MIAYIVSNNTINALVKGFEIYGVDLQTDYKGIGGIMLNVCELRNAVGQKLLDQNYKSVNYRYNEDTPTPTYEYEDIDVDPGIILGCARCYNYQACETEDYFESDICEAINKLKMKMLDRYIANDGYEQPWGID